MATLTDHMAEVVTHVSTTEAGRTVHGAVTCNHLPSVRQASLTQIGYDVTYLTRKEDGAGTLDERQDDTGH